VADIRLQVLQNQADLDMGFEGAFKFKFEGFRQDPNTSMFTT